MSENYLVPPQSEDTTTLINVIKAQGESGDPYAVPTLIKLMQTTPVTNIRNDAAIALRDLVDVRAFQPLAELITDPKTKGQRGTLLYALEVFDCVPILPLLVDLIINGNFEESHQAFLDIEAIESPVSQETLQLVMDKVKAALAQPQNNQELLEDLLDMLQEAYEPKLPTQ
jgi:hypothetical protein